MSSYLAIATVTATLAHILSQATRDLLPGVHLSVTTESPSKFKDAQTPTGGVEAWLNIFAYQIETDAALRNDDLPSRSQNGRVVQQPQVALKINYLLTFYGNEAKLEPQLLLGKAVSTLHASPVIVPGIKAAEIDAFKGTYPFVTDPNLTAQQARVRLTPLPLSLEDLSKLWSVFFHTEYHLSVAYQAAVVLIAADEPAPPPVLPVRESRIIVEPTLAPAISTLIPLSVPPGGQLTIQGQHLQGGTVQVILDEQMLVAPEQVRRDPMGQLVVTALPPGLSAGVHTLRVAQTMDVGTAAAPDLRRVMESGAVAFVLQPTITQHALAASTLTLTVEPAIAAEQAVTLWLDEDPPPGKNPQVYGLVPQARQNPTQTLAFDVSQVAPGTYRLRLRVDRAESPGEPARTWTDNAPNAPAVVTP